jgi:hypothetical protein
MTQFDPSEIYSYLICHGYSHNYVLCGDESFLRSEGFLSCGADTIHFPVIAVITASSQWTPFRTGSSSLTPYLSIYIYGHLIHTCISTAISSLKVSLLVQVRNLLPSNGRWLQSSFSFLCPISLLRPQDAVSRDIRLEGFDILVFYIPFHSSSFIVYMSWNNICQHVSIMGDNIKMNLRC